MFMYHLCIIIILYKRERGARRAMHLGAGGLRTRTFKHTSFISPSFSRKYIILVNHPFFSSFIHVKFLQ